MQVIGRHVRVIPFFQLSLADVEAPGWLDRTVRVQYSFERLASPEASKAYDCKQGEIYSIDVGLVDYIAPFNSDGESRDVWDRMRYVALAICEKWDICKEDRCDFIIRIFLAGENSELVGFNEDGYFNLPTYIPTP